MSKKNRWNRGETLVEVMATMVSPSADGNLAGICQVQQSSTGKEQAFIGNRTKKSVRVCEMRYRRTRSTDDHDLPSSQC